MRAAFVLWALVLVVGCPTADDVVPDAGTLDAGTTEPEPAPESKPEPEPEPEPAPAPAPEPEPEPELPPILDERSLVFLAPALLDDASVVGLGRLMSTIAPDGHGGRLLERWFMRFATTAHSERVGPALLLEQTADLQGDDASTWDLDLLPFVVTGVHNRIDLAARAVGGHCGEFRVSLASVDDTVEPFHVIFLFRMPAADGDVDDAGVVHCRATARSWALLSAHDDDTPSAAFLDDARAMLERYLTEENFLLAESVEFTIAPWEWRQWVKVPNDDVGLPFVFDNPPLFQTVDTTRLNQAGATRDSFLSFVEENADGLDARVVEIPETFRAPSARVNEGVPWIPLDLDGVDDDTLGAHPNLRQNIELMGCPACHTADADFVHTDVDRTLSPFYLDELIARAAHLEQLAHGDVVGDPPFGPLQDDPVLPP